jgi:MSP (Major sperm protein) domain
MRNHSTEGFGININPSECLEFIVNKLAQTSDSVLEIHNNLDLEIAYKIRSSSPRVFSISESEGRISSKSKKLVYIVYNYSEESYRSFHKFLLQTAVLTKEGISEVNWKSNGVYEYKLCAKFFDRTPTSKETQNIKIFEQPQVIEETIEESVQIQKPSELNLKKKKFDFVKKINQKSFSAFHVFCSFVLGSLTTYFIVIYY